MKLSPKEGDVLAAVELDAEKPIAKIRRESGHRDHTIRYHLKTLEERDVIKPRPFINLNSIGFVEYNIYFSIGSLRQKDKEAFLKALLQTNEVIWIAEMGSDYQYGLSVVEKEIHAVREFLYSLSKRFAVTFFEKSVSALFSVTWFPRKYLTSKKIKVSPITITKTRQIEPDELDEKILNGLANIPHRSRRELAQKLAVPLSTLELRVKKLEKEGVIVGYGFGVNCSKYEMLTFKLLIFAKGIDHELTDNLYKFCETNYWTVLFIECFGSWDYEINVEVRRPEEVIGVAQELLERCGSKINNIKVLSKFRDLKGLAYPNLLVQPPASAQRTPAAY